MRLALVPFAVSLFVGLAACAPPTRAPAVASASLSAAEAAGFDTARAESACAESLSAFTAADVRARRDAHAVVARVEPGVVARAERSGLFCEATLDVTWREARDEQVASEQSERVRVVAHRRPDGELAVLVHEEAPLDPEPTAAVPEDVGAE